jgi:hypothetical protein
MSERSAVPDRRRRPEHFVGLIPSGRKRGLQLPGGVASHCRLGFEYKYLVEFAAVFDAALRVAGDWVREKTIGKKSRDKVLVVKILHTACNTVNAP